MARVCTVCTHDNRATIDRIIANGTVSNRAVARQFGLNRGAIDRHAVDHVHQVIAKAVQRKEQRLQDQVKNIWETRLNDTYERATQGSQAAPDDPRWISPILKGIELGLRSTGVLAGAEAGTRVTINAGHLLLLPTGGQVDEDDAIDVEAEDVTEGDG